MKLTIIPVDGSIGIDGKFYINIDLSSCNIPNNVQAFQWDNGSGWIEFNTPIANEEITVLPQWALACELLWNTENTKPSPDELPPTAQQNKQIAVKKLQATDWATAPDVGDSTKSNPYLSNVQDFVAYRNSIRQYAINPVSGVINWTSVPQEVWTTV
jgi:hypothetical protein